MFVSTCAQLEAVKFAMDVQQGIPSQCFVKDRLARPDPGTCANILLKVHGWVKESEIV